MKANSDTRISSFIWLMSISLLVTAIVGGLSWHYGSTSDFHLEGMATVSRTLNILLGVVLTTIALIVPLTSNLYSPQLVKLFITQPIIVCGLITLVLAILFNLSSNFIAVRHPYYDSIVAVSICMAYLGLAGIIPYLFMISRFLRPSYFIPSLAQKAMRGVVRIKSKGSSRRDWIRVVETIDVFSNIARTSTQRNDQQLMILILRFLHEILNALMLLPEQSRQLKDDEKPLFVSGLTREAKMHLQTSGLWPEAYVLFQIARVTEHCDQHQNVVFAESGKLMVKAVRHAVANHCEATIELIIISLNRLMRVAIDNKDTTKFQNLSYYYVLAADAVHDNAVWMNEVIRHLKHYGGLADKSEVVRARETLVFDLSALCCYLHGEDRTVGVDFLENQLVPYLRFTIEANPYLAKATLQAVVKLYWELKACDKVHSCNRLKQLFLKDDAHHAEVLTAMLRDNRPLHWELNDRLLRFAYISHQAEVLAQAFLQRQ